MAEKTENRDKIARITEATARLLGFIEGIHSQIDVNKREGLAISLHQLKQEIGFINSCACHLYQELEPPQQARGD